VNAGVALNHKLAARIGSKLVQGMQWSIKVAARMMTLMLVYAAAAFVRSPYWPIDEEPAGACAQQRASAKKSASSMSFSDNANSGPNGPLTAGACGPRSELAAPAAREIRLVSVARRVAGAVLQLVTATRRQSSEVYQAIASGARETRFQGAAQRVPEADAPTVSCRPGWTTGMPQRIKEECRNRLRWLAHRLLVWAAPAGEKGQKESSRVPSIAKISYHNYQARALRTWQDNLILSHFGTTEAVDTIEGRMLSDNIIRWVRDLRATWGKYLRSLYHTLSSPPTQVDNQFCQPVQVDHFVTAVEGQGITYKGYTQRRLGQEWGAPGFASQRGTGGTRFVRSGFGIMADATVHRCRALMDSGADISLMSEEQAAPLGIHPFGEGDYPFVRQADGSPIQWRGYAMGALFICGRAYPHVWFVAVKGKVSPEYDIIVGTDLMSRIGAFTADFDQNQLSLTDRQRGAEYIFPTRNAQCVVHTGGPDSWGPIYQTPRHPPPGIPPPLADPSPYPPSSLYPQVPPHREADPFYRDTLRYPGTHTGTDVHLFLPAPHHPYISRVLDDRVPCNHLVDRDTYSYTSPHWEPTYYNPGNDTPRRYPHWQRLDAHQSFPQHPHNLTQEDPPPTHSWYPTDTGGYTTPSQAQHHTVRSGHPTHRSPGYAPSQSSCSGIIHPTPSRSTHRPPQAHPRPAGTPSKKTLKRRRRKRRRAQARHSRRANQARRARSRGKARARQHQERTQQRRRIRLNSTVDTDDTSETLTDRSDSSDTRGLPTPEYRVAVLLWDVSRKPTMYTSTPPTAAGFFQNFKNQSRVVAMEQKDTQPTTAVADGGGDKAGVKAKIPDAAEPSPTGGPEPNHDNTKEAPPETPTDSRTDSTTPTPKESSAPPEAGREADSDFPSKVSSEDIQLWASVPTPEEAQLIAEASKIPTVQKTLDTDPSLPVPECTLSPEQKKACEDYNITEPTLTSEQKLILLQVLQDNEWVFARKKMELGACNTAMHHIDTGDHKPIFCNPYKMPFAHRGILKQELDDLERADIIEKCSSPWAAPVLYVPKKDGKLRLCCDLRRLNAVAAASAYPLPRIGDIFATLEGARYFTCLDLACGFWQILLDEESRQKASFTTMFGQYRYKRLPFGLATAPGAFQKIMNEILADINWIACMVYIDDIIIFTEDFASHVKVLDKVLKRLISSNLKVKLSKCEFSRTQLNYLGHVINSRGRMTDPEKVSAVMEMPTPQCAAHIETFLGKVGYYQAFIPDYADLTRPLQQLKHMHAEWKWGQTEQNAFDELKKRLSNAPVLRHPDFKRKFILQTDASGYGLGAVLSQVFEDGEEHPIAYASRVLHSCETRYSTIHKEALAIKWGIEHFKQYLTGVRFLVQTDHRPLMALPKMKEQNNKLRDIALHLQGYLFDIEYRPGKSNQNADLLSRVRYPVITLSEEKAKKRRAVILEAYRQKVLQSEKDARALDRANKAAVKQVKEAMKGAGSASKGKTKAEKRTEASKAASETRTPTVGVVGVRSMEDIVAEYVNWRDPCTMDEAAGTPEQRGQALTEGAMPSASLANLQRRGAKATADEAEAMWANLPALQRADEWCGMLINYLERDELPVVERLAREILLTRDKYDLDGGILVHNPVTGRQLCVPEVLREAVMFHVHNPPSSGHLGFKKCIYKLTRHYYWPRCYSDLKEYIGKCRECSLNKPPARNHREQLGERPVPTDVWQYVHMDIWKPNTKGEFAVSRNGNKRVLALVDSFSKFVVLRAIPDETKETVANVLANDVFPQYGPPEQLISDRGSAFTSQLQAEMLETFGIVRRLVIPKHPRANGQAERFFRVLRTMESCLLNGLDSAHNDRWDEYLQHLAFAYNTSYHRSVGNTPYFLMHARHPNTTIYESGGSSGDESIPLGRTNG
jgi:hypothetical protein